MGVASCSFLCDRLCARVVQMRQAFTLLVVCIAVAAATPITPEDDILRNSFEDWVREHGVSYGGSEEYETRFGVYKANVAAIDKMNQEEYGGPGVQFALNKFADLTVSEFKDRILMYPQRGPEHPQDRYMEITEQDAPDSWDWRDHGAVTEVRDQGGVGTCWAESTVGNVEGQWALAGNKLTQLSVEQIVECDGEEQPSQGKADCGVFGGWPYLAMQYIIQAGGLQSEKSYPYCVGDGSCFPCQAPGYNASLCGPPVAYCNATHWPCRDKSASFAATIKDWKALSTNETELAAQLATVGPVSVALDASALQFYHRGVFAPHFCSKTDLDHAVLMVGYGSEKTIFGKEKPFWIVKNSWGVKWGEKGYFRILRGEGKCGINTQAVTSVV